MTLAVSLEQAVATALQGWLATQFPDAKIFDRWPEASVELPTKAISVLTSGGPRTDFLDEFMLSSVYSVGNVYTYTWRVAQRELPMQLDVWANNHPQLDDLVARLLPALRASKAQSLAAFLAASGNTTLQSPIENDLTLQLPGAWSQVLAGYVFNDPRIDENADGVKRRDYRASYRGTAYYDVILTSNASQLNTIVLREYLANVLNANPPTGSPIHISTITATAIHQTDGTT